MLPSYSPRFQKAVTNLKTVRLPIYEDDVELDEYLEVSVEILRKLAQTSIVYKDHVKVVKGLTAEQEINVLERIIHDELPPAPVLPVMNMDAKKPTTVYKTQKVELPPREQWERISQHPNYEINPLLEVRNFWTKRKMEVTTTPTRVKMVELHDKMGHPQLFSLHNLSAMVYGS